MDQGVQCGVLVLVMAFVLYGGLRPLAGLSASHRFVERQSIDICLVNLTSTISTA